MKIRRHVIKATMGKKPAYFYGDEPTDKKWCRKLFHDNRLVANFSTAGEAKIMIARIKSAQKIFTLFTVPVISLIEEDV